MRRKPYPLATEVLSILMVIVGLAIVARTIAEGGGALAVGIVFGVLFVLAGAGRFWVARRRP
jgi:hypothetical protein